MLEHDRGFVTESRSVSLVGVGLHLTPSLGLRENHLEAVSIMSFGFSLFSGGPVRRWRIKTNPPEAGKNPIFENAFNKWRLV